MRSFIIIGLTGVFAAALDGCKVTGTTDSTPIVTSPPIITTDIKDSTSYPANSSVLVRAHVTRAGFPLPLAAVTWAIAAGHGKLSATTATTDTSGVASVIFTLSDTAGMNALAIGSSGVADTLHLIGVVGQPSGLVVVGSNASTVSVGSPAVLQVKVVDRPGNGVARTTVNWTTSGGTLSASSSTSDTNGIAQTTFTASRAGTYQVTATLPGEASVVFTIVVQ